MEEIKICCPKCRTILDEVQRQLALSTSLNTFVEGFCPSCGSVYHIHNGIIDFDPEDHFYWGEISQREMNEINQRAEQAGWFKSLSTAISDFSNRDLTHYLFDQVRVAGLFHYYDTERKEAVLDLGSGWGPIAFGLSNFYNTVYSMDGVYERLRFQAIRASQDGVANIRIMKGNLLKLPVEDNSMDTVIVNGVLEWIGLSDFNTDPKELQKQFLTEVYRVLKPGGRIFIGIENRFGVQCLLGARDHSGLRFTSILPRWLANWVMKIYEGKVAQGGENFSFSNDGAKYRTLTYSLYGYKDLLQNTGYTHPIAYWTRADYNYPWISGTLDGNSVKFYLKNFASHSNGSYQALMKWSARLPKGILGYLTRTFSSNFLIVANKEKPVGGLEKQIVNSEKQVSFLRTTLNTKAGLNTVYWILNGHGVEKIVELQPTDHEGQNDFEIQEIEPVQGHPLRIDSLEETRAAIQWLAGFQVKNQSALLKSEDLQEEIDALSKCAKKYIQNDDLLQLLDSYHQQYRSEISNYSIPAVVEQGDFTPENIILSQNQVIQVIHWEYSIQRGNPMMDIGALLLSLLLKHKNRKEPWSTMGPIFDTARQYYPARFEILLYFSPGYYALRSLFREAGDRGINPENYVSWIYWVNTLNIALRMDWIGNLNTKTAAQQ